MRWLVLMVLLFTNRSALAGSDSCLDPDVARLVGAYDFTTVVLGAKESARIGSNAYFRMTIAADGCSLRASVVQLGFAEERFARAAILYGRSSATIYRFKAGLGDRNSTPPAVLVDAELHSDDGIRESIGFTFVGSEGFWRHLGETWQKSGMWGALVSERVQTIARPFEIPRSLACEYRTLGLLPSAVAFICGDLVIATPTLDKVLWHLPASRQVDDHFAGRLLTDPSEAGEWLEFCWRSEATQQGHVGKLSLKDGKVVVGTTDDADQRCAGTQVGERWRGPVVLPSSVGKKPEPIVGGEQYPDKAPAPSPETPRHRPPPSSDPMNETPSSREPNVPELFDWKNCTITFEGEPPVTIQNGSASWGEEAEGQRSAELVDILIADWTPELPGKEVILVFQANTRGGNYQGYVFVAMSLGEDGLPHQLGQMFHDKYDTGVYVSKWEIRDRRYLFVTGELILDGDAACCPSGRFAQLYELRRERRQDAWELGPVRTRVRGGGSK